MIMTRVGYPSNVSLNDSKAYECILALFDYILSDKDLRTCTCTCTYLILRGPLTTYGYGVQSTMYKYK